MKTEEEEQEEIFFLKREGMIRPLLKDWQRVMLQRYDREKYLTDRALREEIHKQTVTNTSQESQFILSSLGEASPTLQHLHSNTPT